MPESSLYIVMSAAGPVRDLARDAREQPWWDEHAAFIDALVDEGLILLGGPLVEEGGALMVVRARSEDDIRARLAGDPWYEHGVLRLVAIKRWEVFIDQWRHREPRD